MGKSISQKKADIAWGLGDTHVVRVDSVSDYDDLASSWGWDKLKDLPSRNLEEKLPELDDDVIEKHAGVDASSSNNTRSTKSTGGDGKNPESYRAKLRVGSNSRKYYTTTKIGDIVDTLETDGEKLSAGHYSGTYLIIHSDDESARTVGSSVKRHGRAVALRAPDYVYEYLEGREGVYESRTEMYEDNAGVSVTLSDGTQMDIRDVPETDMLLSVGQKNREYFEDRPDELAEYLGYDADEYDRFTFIEPTDLDGSWDVTTDAKVIKTTDSRSFDEFDDYTYKSDSFADLKGEDIMSDIDEDTEEYEALFGYRYGNPDNSTKEVLVDVFHAATTEGETIN